MLSTVSPIQKIQTLFAGVKENNYEHRSKILINFKNVKNA